MSDKSPELCHGSLTPTQRDIMRHALGLNYSPRHTRNYFCASLGDGTHISAIQALVSSGLMVAGSTINGGRDQYFVVTPEGIQLVEALEPKPKRLTRSQLRYQRFLETDSSLSFRDWLACEASSGIPRRPDLD